MHCVAEDDLEPLSSNRLVPSAGITLGEHYTFCGAGNQTQGSVPAESSLQALKCIALKSVLD